MTNTVENRPVSEPIEEKKVEKELVVEPESTTTEDKPAEPAVNGNGKAEEENGESHEEEAEDDNNCHVDEAEEEETTLKRKDAPTEVEEDSPKKKKLIDSDEKGPEAAVEG